MTCSVCGPLLVGDGSRYGEAKLKDVKESGALGYSGFTLTLNAFLSIHPTSLEDPSLIKQIHSQLPENPGPLNLYLGNPGEVNIHELAQVNPFISEGTKIKKWPRIGARSPVPESTGCEASLQQLDNWFKDCRKTHPICCAESRGLPRRVIDIGNTIEFPNNIRLYESHHEQKDYICLSHRWPEVPSMQTLKSNIEKYKADIPFKALPLSFQHTLQVTHFLRVQYVWIDAMCIIQDDEDDKSVNIAEMDSIYESSALTIISIWATDSSQGLFRVRQEVSRHHEVHIDVEDGERKTFLAWQFSLPHFFDKWWRLSPYSHALGHTKNVSSHAGLYIFPLRKSS